MSQLSSETRRLLDAARSGDEPTAEGEQAVREGLTARLGVAALAGVTGASATLGAIKSAGAASTSALSSAAKLSGGLGSPAANAISAGALPKVLAGLFLVAGLGTGALTNETFADRAVAWSAPIPAQVQRAFHKAKSLVIGNPAEVAQPIARPDVALDEWPSSDVNRHERLMTIARRPDHPIAKEVELVLILGAERALAAGDDALARRYLDEHETRFARGALCGDREALRVLVDGARGADSRDRSPNF